jgi:hypothetical protein
MSKKMRTVYIVIWSLIMSLLGCSSQSIKPSHGTIVIDEDLMRKSNYIDIVYEDGAYSYVSYLKSSDLREERKEPACAYAAQQPMDTTKGVWIWDYKKIIGHEKETLERLQKENVRRVYIQIGGPLEAFRLFLVSAKAQGIAVYALDGSPDYINDYTVLIDDILKIRGFNRINRDAGFEGIQMDVEPYLQKDFNLRKQYYVKQFLKMAQELRQYAGNDIKLSFALPFWFDTLIIDEKPLSFHIIDIADEAVIMSYRTDYDEILDSASQELCYASSVGKPVYLGLEINRLPNEEHFIVEKSVLERFAIRTESRTVLSKGPYDGLPVVKRYNVKADKITFFAKKNVLPRIMSRVPQFKSFNGYVIHSYEAYE